MYVLIRGWPLLFAHAVEALPVRFAESSYAGTVVEGAAKGTRVLRVIVYEADDGEGGTVELELKGDSHQDFQVLPDGSVEVAAGIDRETVARYELDVVATDSAGLTATVSLNITVVDVNDHAPEFDQDEYVAEVKEGTPLQPLRFVDRRDRGATVVVTNSDGDAGVNGQISYALSGQDASAFDIDAVTGLITPTVVFDREDKDAYNFNVVARDGGSPPRQRTAPVFVRVLDVDDNRPVFTSSEYNFVVDSDVAPGTSVGYTHVSDRDIATDVLFSLSSRTIRPADQGFSIDAVTGEVIVSADLSKPAPFIHNYELWVMARDTVNLTKAPLTIKVNSVGCTGASCSADSPCQAPGPCHRARCIEGPRLQTPNCRASCQCDPSPQASPVWPTTICDAAATVPCGAGKTGLMRRVCQPDGSWESFVDTSDCQTTALLKASLDFVTPARLQAASNTVLVATRRGLGARDIVSLQLLMQKMSRAVDHTIDKAGAGTIMVRLVNAASNLLVDAHNPATLAMSRTLASSLDGILTGAIAVHGWPAGRAFTADDRFRLTEALQVLTNLRRFFITGVTREASVLVLRFKGAVQPPLKQAAAASFTGIVKSGQLLQTLQDWDLPPWQSVVRLEIHQQAVQRDPDLMDSFEEVVLALADVLPPGTQIHFGGAHFGSSLYSIDCSSFSGLHWNTNGILRGPENSIDLSSDSLQDYECQHSGVVFTWAANSKLHVFDELTQYDVATASEASTGTFTDSPLISVSGVNFPETAPGLIVYEASSLSGRGDEADCVFWDANALDWSSEGCRLMGDRASPSKAVCQCDHRTSFVILTSIGRGGGANSSSGANNETGTLSEQDAFALDLITRVGVGISAPLLLIIVLTVAYFRQQRKMFSRVILAHICFNMAISELIFIVGVDQINNDIICSAIAIFLHWFLLVTFAWMGVNGWYLWITFCVTYGRLTRREGPLLMVALAYGVPTVLVAVCAGVSFKGYGTLYYCWLDPNGLIFAFIVPVAIVVVGNLCVYVRVLHAIRKVRWCSLPSVHSLPAFHPLSGAGVPHVGVRVLSPRMLSPLTRLYSPRLYSSRCCPSAFVDEVGFAENFGRETKAEEVDSGLQSEPFLSPASRPHLAFWPHCRL